MTGLKISTTVKEGEGGGRETRYALGDFTSNMVYRLSHCTSVTFETVNFYKLFLSDYTDLFLNK